MSDKEKISQWMMGKGYATGHGTTVGDLLQELEWQVAENQQPVREVWCDCGDGIMPNSGAKCGNCITAESAVREWVGLTDEDLEPMCDDWRIVFGPHVHDFARSIEAKLKEKNT